MPKKEKAAAVSRGGKSTVYSERLATLILERIAMGETLATICKDSGYPSPSTVMGWVVYPEESIRPGFSAGFERATRIGLHMMAQDIVDISDDSGKDTVTRVFKGKRVKVIDHENINRDRLRVETRKWIISKRLSEQYGDTVKHEHSGTVDLVARLQAGRERAAKARATAPLILEAAAEVIEQGDGDTE